MFPSPKSCPDLEELYDKIYRYCYFRVRQKELAEDLTQETFLRFLSGEGYLESGKILQYLYTIARNLCIDEFRKSAACPVFMAEQVEALYGADPSPPIEETVVASLSLRAALSRLSVEEQELILLRYVDEMPVKDLCVLLGISRFALYRKASKALKKVRAYLENIPQE